MYLPIQPIPPVLSIPPLPRSGNYLVDCYDDWLDSQEEEDDENN